MQDDDTDGKIATIGSIFSGCLFCCGWFLFWGVIVRAHRECMVWSLVDHGFKIDCPSSNHTTEEHELQAPEALVSGAYWGPGILSSVGLIGLNAISWEAVVEDGTFGDGVVACARWWTLSSLVLVFGGLGYAIWCIVSDFQTPHAWHWGGVMTFLQTLCIVTAAFTFRLCRRSGDHAI